MMGIRWPRSSEKKDTAQWSLKTLAMINFEGPVPQIQPSLGNCWLWTGHKHFKGYARIRVKGKMVRLHRWCFELFKGKIPTDAQLDHLCRVRHCCNPDHLEAVSSSENQYRGIRDRKMETLCGQQF